ncbi:polymerase [Enterobacter sp. CGMCC 5087]|nr:polymerase [Enterobacter sp. CGMCC 5087]
MKFTVRLIRFVIHGLGKRVFWSVFGQGDEFTCVDHFPSPLAML